MGWEAELTVSVYVNRRPDAFNPHSSDRKKAIEDLAKKGGLPVELESTIKSMSAPTHFEVPKISIPFGDFYILWGVKWFQLINPYMTFAKENCGYPASQQDYSLSFLLDFFDTCFHKTEEEGTYTLEMRDDDGEEVEGYDWTDLWKELETEEEKEADEFPKGLECFLMTEVVPFWDYLKELDKIRLEWLEKGYVVNFKWITSY